MVLNRLFECYCGTQRKVAHSHLGGIVRVTVGPDQIEVILKLSFGLVLFLLHFLQHRLQVHGIRDDFKRRHQIQNQLWAKRIQLTDRHGSQVLQP